jgi:hypothetical protein
MTKYFIFNIKLWFLDLYLKIFCILTLSTAIELKHFASKNWLIHLHYVRREFGTCKTIIHEELQKTNGNLEYANYVLVSRKLIFLVMSTYGLAAN